MSVALSRSGCATARLGSTSYDGSIAIPEMNLAETPSVYEVQPGITKEALSRGFCCIQVNYSVLNHYLVTLSTF